MTQVSQAGLTTNALMMQDLVNFLKNQSAVDLAPSIVLTIEKTHPTSQDKAKFIDALAKVIVKDFLVYQNRRRTYLLRMNWSETFHTYKEIKYLVDDAVAQVEQHDADPRIRKGALAVQIAVMQIKLLHLSTLKDLTPQESNDATNQLIDPFLDKNIPLQKLIKSYQAITSENLSESSRAKLKRTIIDKLIKRQTGKAETSETIKLLEQLMMTDSVTLNEVLHTIEHYLLPHKLKSYFTYAETLCNIFSGKELTQTISDVEKVAHNEGQNMVDLFNFAITLYQYRRGKLNSLTIACKEIALRAVSHHVVDLVNRLLQSYQEEKKDVSAAIMQEVDRHNIGPQFSECLKKILSDRSSSSRQDKIIQSIGAIYDAMNTLGFHSHNMKASEVMQCAEVAERYFRKSRAYRPVVISDLAPRTFVYDPQQKTISFLNKAKGGKVPLFGSAKEVSSTITIIKTTTKEGVHFIAQTKRAATLKKDLLSSKIDTELWEREIEAVGLNKGLEGLLSYETMAIYSQKVGDITQKRVLLIMKDYDFATFMKFSQKTEMTMQAMVGYYMAVAKGLCNLHTPPNDGVIRKPRVHGDLNPRNMFAALDGTAVIGDFGFVTYPSRNESLPLLVPYYGSVGYSDPEVTVLALQAKQNGKSDKDAVAKLDLFALDCFAMGVSMYHTLHGHLPKTMTSQLAHYKADTMSASQAIALKEQHAIDQEVQVRTLEKIPERSVQQEFERIAWMLMHPDASLRLKAPGLLASLQELQKKV